MILAIIAVGEHLLWDVEVDGDFTLLDLSIRISFVVGIFDLLRILDWVLLKVLVRTTIGSYRPMDVVDFLDDEVIKVILKDVVPFCGELQALLKVYPLVMRDQDGDLGLGQLVSVLDPEVARLISDSAMMTTDAIQGVN